MRTILVFHYGTVDVGNDVASVHNVVTNIRYCCVRIYGEFGLGAGDQRCQWGNDGTHVKDMENPTKF